MITVCESPYIGNISSTIFLLTRFALTPSGPIGGLRQFGFCYWINERSTITTNY